MSGNSNRKEYNVLILSAGRRVELLECFKSAAKRLGVASKIIAADVLKTAPAIFFADKTYMISRIGTPSYIDELTEIIKKENIALVVPTIDTELSLLSENKEKIEAETGTKILVSDKRVIDICRNKKNTTKFFEKYYFGVPRQITDEDIKNENYKFPLFIKPEDGSSSINAFRVNDKNELDFFRGYIKNPIVQEYAYGEEYTIDAFLDFESNLITCCPRLRMAVRSGEILKGKIVKNYEIINDVKRLLDVLKPIGHITIQCKKTDTKINYVEINPRFGGGAPMSIMAGADSCENLYRLLMGEKLSYSENYDENVIFLRFDKSIKIDDNFHVLK